MKQNDIRKDLRSLAGLLSGWGRYVKNPNILHTLSILENTGTKDLRYSIYESEPLTFIKIDLDRHCLPTGIEKLAEDDVDFEVKLTFICSESNEDSFRTDPIKSLGVNIIIDLCYNDGKELKHANCSWHLDKRSPTEASFSHPEYHMNFGGNHMVKQGNVFGNLLLLPSPRIIHPPMDIILSCDFIIRNFYTRQNHKKITQNPAYLEIIKNAKARYWSPYTSAFSSNWDASKKVENLPYINLVGHH